jgi:serine/threonine-protein kinase
MISKPGEAADLAPSGVEEEHLARVRAIAELRHPHLIVMWPDDEGGFEAELGAGRTLAELQAAHGPLPLAIALRILLDAMSGLSALHRARVGSQTLDFVHGEVTPNNIVVGRDGVARLVPIVETHWSAVALPPADARGYTAPEKLLGDSFDQRADVFSAGVLLWEAMMGRSLFGGASVETIVTQLVGGKVTRPAAGGDDAPWGADLADVVMRALAVDPADRWAHVGIMGADIETIAEGRMAKASDLIVLVTGRDVSRDSLSDEVTRPLASLSSLSPFANSIPAPDEPTSPHTPGALGGRRSDSTEPVETPFRPPTASRPPMPERHRRTIVGGALAFSLLVLLVAGIKALTPKPESSDISTVLAPPAAQPAAAPLADPPAAPPSLAPADEPIAAPEPAPSAAAAKTATVAASPSVDAKGARVTPRTSASSGKTKPNDDPFGLMKPVRAKPKNDPFGL